MDNLKKLEENVTIFLQQYAKDDISKNEIAPHLARVSLLMNHLYQDLGFENRIKMNNFMQEHFPKLTLIKPKDKLWKKFIYDGIGEVAPACASCPDQTSCFKCNF